MYKEKTLTKDEWQRVVLLLANVSDHDTIYSKALARVKRYQLSVCGLFGIGEVRYIDGYDTKSEAEKAYKGILPQVEKDEMLSLVLIDTKQDKILRMSVC